MTTKDKHDYEITWEKLNIVEKIVMSTAIVWFLSVMPIIIVIGVFALFPMFLIACVIVLFRNLASLLLNQFNKEQ